VLSLQSILPSLATNTDVSAASILQSRFPSQGTSLPFVDLITPKSSLEQQSKGAGVCITSARTARVFVQHAMHPLAYQHHVALRSAGDATRDRATRTYLLDPCAECEQENL